MSALVSASVSVSAGRLGPAGQLNGSGGAASMDHGLSLQRSPSLQLELAVYAN